jgi:hypothetical protein
MRAMSDEYTHDREGNGGAPSRKDRGLSEPARTFEPQPWDRAAPDPQTRPGQRERRMVGWWILPSFVLGLGVWGALIGWLVF